MSRPSARGRTRACGPAEARKRLADAEKYLEVAHLVEGEAGEFPQSATVAAGLAVLAAIAAADAACCAVLRQSSRSYDHADAAQLLQQISPGGAQAAKEFGRVIGKKDLAHYSFLHLATQDLKTVMRNTDAVVSFARKTVAGHP